MSKEWAVPYTSGFWDSLSMMHWRIFSEHLLQDQKEKEELLRDIAEYAMAFHNYEAVRSVQQTREQQASLEDEKVTDIFMQQVEKMFGDKARDFAANALQKPARPTPTENKPAPPSTRQRMMEQQEDIIRVKKKVKDKKDK